jgi:hypothetical protein
MKRWIIPLLVGVFGLSGLTLATTALPAAAYNVPDIATAAAYTADVQSVQKAGYAWSTSTYNCVVFNNAVMIQAQPAGIRRSTLQNSLIGPDEALAVYPTCGPQGQITPGAKEAQDTGGTSSRNAHTDPSVWCTSGPYNSWWNINQTVGSAWMFMQWHSFLCAVGENFPGTPGASPFCMPGSTWPNATVNVTFCGNIRNDVGYYSTDRITFDLNIQVLFFTKSFHFWYWENNWGNGNIEQGCQVLFSYGCTA